MTKPQLNLILLGDPAAGKATQAQVLVKKYRLYDFDMGKILRQTRLRNKAFDQVMKRTIDHGKLAPTSIVRKIFSESVNRVPKTKGIVFDGTPKMLGEAKLLSKLLKETKRSKPLVIYLQIPLDESIKRMRSRTEYAKKRADDNRQALKNRVKYYHKNIRAVMDYFGTVYTLSHIDGTGSQEQVRKRIHKAIDFYLKNYGKIYKDI